MNIIERVDTLATSSWIGLLILGVLLFLALAFATNRSHYNLLLRLFTSSQMRVISYDDQTTELWADIALVLVALVSTALVVFVPLYGTLVTLWWHFFVLVGVVLVWYLLHIAIIKLVGVAFNLKQINLVIRLYVIAFVFMGVLFIPLGIAMIYYPILLMKGMIIVAAILYCLTLLMLSIKTVVILGGTIGSIFYIFLYLCSAEILPFLVIYKLGVQVLINV